MNTSLTDLPPVARFRIQSRIHGSQFARGLVAAGTLAVLLSMAGCKKADDTSQTATPDQTQTAGQEAADGGLAPVDNTQAAAPAAAPASPAAAPRRYTSSNGGSRQYDNPPTQYANNQQGGEYANQDQGYNQGDYGTVNPQDEPVDYATQPPPPLPQYQQPEIPAPGYVWTPGYWQWNPQGYYWVPGVWTNPPYVGALWTPGYWGFTGGRYGWHRPYWGPYVGFYGGVNYGFGYGGLGFFGGYWRGGDYFYNRSVNNVSNVNITNVYTKNVTVINNTHVSYNGGPGGVERQPTPAERAALQQPRREPLPAQQQFAASASKDRQNFASVNGGHPAMAAAPRPVAAVAKPLPAPRFAPASARAPEAARPGQPERPGQPAAEHAPNGAMGGAMNTRPAAEAARPGQPAPKPAQPTMANHAAMPAPKPEAKPAPTPMAHPAPAARPEAPKPAPAPMARPETHSAPAARPEARPAPAPMQHPAPVERPQPAPRPAPAPRPQPEARPAPMQHAAPAPRPAPKPVPKPEEKKPEERK